MFFISPDFDPLSSFFGGILISIASSILLLFVGRISGLSGILYRIFIVSDDWGWRIIFLSGFNITCYIYSLFDNSIFGDLKDSEHISFIPLISGFLVAYGTILGCGCTSGHGVCGIPRFSKRSIVATGIFFVFAMSTSIFSGRYFSNYLYIAGESSTKNIKFEYFPHFYFGIIIVFLIFGLVYCYHKKTLYRALNTNNPDSIQPFYKSILEAISSFFSGAIFSAGLCLSKMTSPHKVLSFLNPLNIYGWDPGLSLTFCGAVGLNMITFRYIYKRSHSICNNKFILPKTKLITTNLIFGAMIFGIGWGLGGICPGPGVLGIFSSRLSNIVWAIGLLLGFFIHRILEKIFEIQTIRSEINLN